MSAITFGLPPRLFQTITAVIAVIFVHKMPVDSQGSLSLVSAWTMGKPYYLRPNT